MDIASELGDDPDIIFKGRKITMINGFSHRQTRWASRIRAGGCR
jgi:hypothetical protein